MSMITYLEGTVFNSKAEAIVNTINCIGIMNAGVALEFGLRYPSLLKEYEEKCKNKEIQIGKIYYYKAKDRIIVNFPTKWHFKYPSKLEWIEAGLKDFVNTYKKQDFKSVAFTKLGTLNGHLDWNDVKKLMEKYLSKIDIDVYICLDSKKDAEGLEADMLKVINTLDIKDLKEKVKLNEKQQIILMKNKPFNRFWKIKELDNIGTTSYKKIFNYCYNIVTKYSPCVQLSFFD